MRATHRAISRFITALLLPRPWEFILSRKYFSRASDTPLLFCYEGELRQILTNLIGNVFDAMRTGGRLILRSRETMHWDLVAAGTRIMIADTGAGTDDATKLHIFEPFYTTKGIPGVGLALWITKQLIEKNGGVILSWLSLKWRSDVLR